MQIGIDLGASKIEYVLLDDVGNEHHRERTEVPKNYQDTLSIIKKIVIELERKAGKELPVGVCHPGIHSIQTGLVKNAPNSFWINGKPLQRDLRSEVGKEIYCENDANCFALSEAIDGSGKHYKIVFGVILGSGVGGGLVIDKRIVNGPNGITGEWGHNQIPSACIEGVQIKKTNLRAGEIENFVAGIGISKAFKNEFKKDLSAQKIFEMHRKLDLDAEKLIDKYDVTHFGGAPIVLNMITGAPASDRKKLKQKVYVLTAGAPPPSIIFKKMKELGFEVMHVYGLTETYGHVTQCAWNDSWNEFDEEKQNEIKARQGVRYPNTEGITVMDPESMKEVPKDGKTIGEIMIKGNVVMKGYLKDKDATDKAMGGGWFHSGDLAVMHPDGYVKIQDRSKDIIISGGENISSIEIENTLAKHPSVSIAAVVAKPDEKWGEVPCAFIEMVQVKPVTEKELISFCKETLAGFKVPKQVVFCELPKTSTGKIQKFELRKKF